MRKADNFRTEGYSQERRVELGNNERVRSASPTLSEGRNGVNECTRGLLEDILARDNMNRAYKRVKSNKGSHGVDGMTVGELLEHLKRHGEKSDNQYWQGRIVLRLSSVLKYQSLMAEFGYWEYRRCLIE